MFMGQVCCTFGTLRQTAHRPISRKCTELLKRHEKSCNYTSPLVKSVISNQLPSNTTCEDFIIHQKIPHKNDFFIGVIDGHGGHQCGQFCANALPHLLRHFHHQPTNPQLPDSPSPADQLVSTFSRMDALIDSQYHSDPNLASASVALSGACACVAHISGDKVHVANIGDCSAFVVSKGTSGFRPVPLSNAHCFDNKDEVERIMSSVSGEEVVFYGGRLLGQLMPLRAFGDFQFKWSRDVTLEVDNFLRTQEVEANISFPACYKSFPYLTAVPEVISYEVRPDDVCVVLTTDGLTDFMGLEDLAAVVGQYLTDFGCWRENVVTRAIRAAFGEEMLEEYLSLPQGVSRRYRDDITAVVVSFI